MHRESSDYDAGGVDASGTVGNRNNACLCGCGQLLPTGRRYVHGHNARANIVQRNIAAPYRTIVLTEQERGAIIGTLLGDSSIGYPHATCSAPRLACNHGGPQEEWCRHKAVFLARLGTTVRTSRNGGWGQTVVRLTTKLVPALIPIYELLRPGGGRKRITEPALDLLGGIGLAWWICDDGSSPGQTMRLHTEGFDEQSVYVAAQWLYRNYGPVTISCGRTCGFFINLNKSCRLAMADAVEPFVPSCMDYKIRVYRSDRKNTGRKCPGFRSPRAF
jgi:hypothetical protein